MVANALVGATVGVSFLQCALATTPSAVVLPIVALTPLIVVPFAYFLENERPSARSLVGGALAVAAAAVLAQGTSAVRNYFQRHSGRRLTSFTLTPSRPADRSR